MGSSQRFDRAAEGGRVEAGGEAEAGAIGEDDFDAGGGRGRGEEVVTSTSSGISVGVAGRSVRAERHELSLPAVVGADVETLGRTERGGVGALPSELEARGAPWVGGSGAARTGRCESSSRTKFIM